MSDDKPKTMTECFLEKRHEQNVRQIKGIWPKVSEDIESLLAAARAEERGRVKRETWEKAGHVIGLTPYAVATANNEWRTKQNMLEAVRSAARRDGVTLTNPSEAK